MYNEIHNDNIASLPSGWFMTGHEGTPSRSRCSIGAAVQTGLVMRHERAGYLYLPDGRGAWSFETAIAERLIDQDAADYIAKQPGCYRSAPMVGVVMPPIKKGRPGTMEEFDGTPVGDFMAALMAWRGCPGVDEQVRVAKALQGLLQTI